VSVLGAQAEILDAAQMAKGWRDLSNESVVGKEEIF